MERKRYPLILLLFLNATIAVLASSLKGTVVNPSAQPMDYVNIALIDRSNGAFVKGTTTDASGKFELSSINEGEYEIKISFVGFQSIQKQVSISTKALNLGKIVLIEDTRILKEVEVVGQGSQVKFDVDKKIYSVDQSIVTNGAAASEVLKNIPSVKVDNEGNVSLRNDANVEVWINGKPSGLTADNRAQILQQMPAESIESVEVMTNPSAKFNPEGSAGVINIVLKKKRQAGVYGSLSAGVMYPENGAARPNFGANINLSSSKLDAYVNMGYRNMKFEGTNTTKRYNLNDAGESLSVLSQDGNEMREFGGFFSRAGIDFHPDKSNTYSLSGFGLYGNMDSENRTHYLTNSVSGNTGSILKDEIRHNSANGYMRSFNLNLDYRHDFTKDENIALSLGYSKHRRGIDTHIVEDSVALSTLNLTQYTAGTNQEITFKTDYTKKITSTNRIEAGWQTTLNNRFSSSAADSIGGKSMDLYKNDFDYNEQIHAAYFTYGDRYFDKLSLLAGVRGEYFVRESTNTTATGIDKIAAQHYLQLFPSIFIGYSLSGKDELQLNITRRINRPHGRQINPFRDVSTAGVLSYGNANLQPEYAFAYELNYIKSWDNHSLSSSLYYRAITNGIERIQFKNNDLLENTYMNLSQRQNSGLEIVSKNRLMKVLNLTSSLNVYYKHISASTYQDSYDASKTTIIAAQNDFTWNANVMANFLLSRTLSGQITTNYAAPNIVAQGKQDAQYRMDFGLRKTFLNRSLTVALTGMDIFNWNKERSTSSGKGFYQTTDQRMMGRMWGITASWNFGNMKPKQTDSKKKQNNTDVMMDPGMD